MLHEMAQKKRFVEHQGKLIDFDYIDIVKLDQYGLLIKETKLLFIIIREKKGNSWFIVQHIPFPYLLKSYRK